MSGSSGTKSFSPLLGVVLIVIIIIVLVFVGMFAMNQIVDQSYSNVDVTVMVSGNDVVVTILGGSKVSDVIALRACIDGTSKGRINSKYVRDISLGKPIVFSDLASGVSGSAFVVVEAMFSNGDIGIVNYVRLQFP